MTSSIKNESCAEVIRRVSEMEALFDMLQSVHAENPSAFLHDAAVLENLKRLIDYYDGGQWLADYILDEQGLLPKDLKRGVLSEDGVYNFLSDLQR